MRWVKWAGVVSALLLILICFFPWVVVPTQNLTLTGMDTGSSNYGKPGYFHIVMAFFFIVLSFIPRVWSKRLNLLIIAMNFAWALRNYFVLTRCEAGECPIKRIGIYIMLLTSVIMMIAALFPDVKLPEEKELKS
jgi:hypothetical protein